MNFNFYVTLNFREGIGKYGTGYEHSNGVLVLTKSIPTGNPIDFILTVIDTINIPFIFSIDFAGFFRKSSQKSTIKFEFPSPNSTLSINENQHFYVNSTEKREWLYNFFENSNLNEIKLSWQSSHDDVGLFSASGLHADKIITCIIYVEPISVKVDHLLKCLEY